MVTRRRHAAVLVLVLLAACGGNPQPNTSPEGQAAIYGRRVVNVGRALLPVIDQEMTAGRLPKDVGIRILESMRVVFVQAEGPLATGLRVIDLAKSAAEAKPGVDQVIAGLASIDQALALARQVTDPKMKAQVDGLLQNLLLALNEVRQLALKAAGG